MPLAVLPDGRPELAVAIPGSREPWGVLHVVGEAAGSLGAARPRGRPGRRPTPSARWSAAPSAPTRSPTCSIGPRRSAASPATSAAGSTSTGSWPAWSTTRWSCSRATAPRSSSSMPTATSRPRSAAACRRRTSRSVRDFPAASLPAAAVAARQPLFAVDYRDDPRGEDVRAAVVQEGFDTLCTAPLMDGTHAPRAAQRLPRPPAPLDGRRARHDRRRWRPRRASRSRPPRTSSGWRPGPPSSSRSSSSARG